MQVQRYTLAACLALTAATARAQKDTSLPGKTVTVTSSYKPVLRPATKLAITASSPAVDSSRPQLQYNIPAPNLFLTYQPGIVSPLALYTDSVLGWQPRHFVKAGFGNYTTPLLQAGFSFGDASKGLLNLEVNHLSSKGKRTLQEFSKTGLLASGVLNTSSLQWIGRVGFDHRLQYRYGFEPDTLKVFNPDSLRQRFTTFHGAVGLANKQPFNGLRYSANLALAALNDGKGNGESNLTLIAPVTKTVGEIFDLNVHFLADLTKLNRGAGAAINNNLVVISPSVDFKTPQLKITAGFNPSWSNDIFTWLPNFSAEYHLKNNRLYVDAGFVGQYQKNSYHSLSMTNPFILVPALLQNTRNTELYGGFKTALGDHFTLNGRLSYQKLVGQPLFLNISAAGNGFQVLFEPEIKLWQIRGEAAYTLQQKFSATAGFTLRDFQQPAQNAQPWGLLPIELNSSLRWQLLKDLRVRADLFFFGGPWSRDTKGNAFQLNPAFDLNAGAELAINKRFSAFLQMNNLLNNPYRRWNQFPVLGINVLGGVVVNLGADSKP